MTNMHSQKPPADRLSSKPVGAEINPAIGAMLKSAHDLLTHEHSLFRSLGLKPVLIGRGKAAFALDAPIAFAGCDGDVHGGLMTIVMDSIFGLTVFTALDEVKPIATINLRTDYINKADVGTRIICSCECIEIRNDIAHVSGRITTEEHDRLLVSGAGTFMVGVRSAKKGSRL